MEWKNKLYDYEVTPPENVWNKIVHDLDNDFLLFKDKLQHAELSPPNDAWNSIAHNLDNNFIFFKDKLQHAEIPAPDDAWNNIVHDIDNNFFLFKDKLNHAEMQPPVEAWNNIHTSLETPAGTKKNTKIAGFPAMRIAAAAAIIGVLFFTLNYFLRTAAPTKDVAVKQTKPLQPRNKSTEASTTAPKVLEEKKQAYIVSAFTKKKHQSFKVPAVISEQGYSNEDNYNVPPPDFVESAPYAATDNYEVNSGFNKYLRNLKGEIKEDVTLLDLPNSYFLMTGPDGQSIRVSSKFRNTIQYLNGTGNEELLDVILRESKYWKNVFTAWKQQVNDASFIPTADNFMDISTLMEMLRSHPGK